MAKSHRRRYNRGYSIGATIGLTIILILLSPIAESWRMNGPMIIGHETLQCIACHKQERGTLRQQLQANTQYLFNRRDRAVSVGYRPVTNQECLACHVRPNDRHPVYRFLEPKYKEIREKIGAQSCATCHEEHRNQRITISPSFCQHCHDELELKRDPLDTSHTQLIQEKKWDSCLGCHDFHGNHEMKVAEKIDRAIPAERIKNYFAQGKDPFPGKIIHEAKTLDYEK